MSQHITAIVLSAGRGKRMGTSLPKSLHPVAGKPILARILTALKRVPVQEIRVVINPEQEHLVQPVTRAFKAKTFVQNQNLLEGTATSALSAKLEEITGSVLIVNGDHPLIWPSDLQNIVKTFHKESAKLCFGSCVKENPGSYGRVLKQGQKIRAILEANALSPKEQQIKEVNAGIYLCQAKWLKTALDKITSSPAKPLPKKGVGMAQQTDPVSRKDHHLKLQEHYLTDIVSMADQEGEKVLACPVSEDSAFGVNTQAQLAFAGKKVWTQKLNSLMQAGVIIIDPLHTYVEEGVVVGQGSVIYPGVSLRGNTSIGAFCAIENNCLITSSTLRDFVLIRAGSYLESAEVGSHTVVGPYAHLRPGSQIKEQCRVGNFVEIKNSQMGVGSKAGHFSYLGDTEVGEDVNIGAGAVTCNLNVDGTKHKTKIGNKVFVGSGSLMVAPVEIGDGSAIGAGSVITKKVPASSLALSRSPQENKENHFNPKTNK